MSDKIVKYFRTFHLPWSESVADDDIVRTSPFDENSNVVVTIKLDGECFPAITPILMSDNTYKNIQNIKVNDIILGVNDDGIIVPSRVKNIFRNGRTDIWTKIYFKDPIRNALKCILCTDNHLLFCDNNYVMAKDIAIGANFKHYETFKEPSQIQKEIIIGKLLGDGSFDKGGIQYTHKLEHKEYIDFINLCLTDSFSKMIIDNNLNSYSKNPKYKAWTKHFRWVKYLRKIMVKNGIKTIPSELIDQITPLSLAVLYMDDGSISGNNKQRARMHFSVCNFDTESCINLQKAFTRYGINTTITNSDGYNYINVSAFSVDDFCMLIKDYIPPIMQYKLPIEYRSGLQVPILDKHSSHIIEKMCDVLVVSKSEISDFKYTNKYDIETETSNYFANGLLVHNCTTAYPSGRTHARSIDSVNHPSRNFLKSYWAERCYQLPEGWRVAGENVFAKHSIYYTDLESYFYVYSIWDENNNCLSFSDTKEWCTLLDLIHVPIIYTGIYDEKLIKQSFLPHKEKHEGYVIRTAGSFHYDDSSDNIAKYVRKNHVATDVHWMHQEIVPNQLKQLTV